MHKTGVIAALFSLSALLAACGGGGSGSITPAPIQTLQPKPVVYTAAYDWTGALHGPAKSKAMIRRMITGGATPEPVQMAQNDDTYGAIGETNVYAVVDPSPSPSVEPSWAPIPAGAPLTTPFPSASSTPGVLTLIPTNGSAAVTLSGTVPIPGDPQTVSPLVYVFPSIPLACVPSLDQDKNAVQGVSFQGGKAVAVTNPSQADLYIDGPHCTGAFANPNETTSTLHVPGGYARFSLNSQSFIDTATSQWTNTATSIDWATLQSTLSDATTSLPLWEAQTTSGHFVRFNLSPIAGGGDATVNGASATVMYDESGYSITGTY